jgi:hypothetical protein
MEWDAPSTSIDAMTNQPRGEGQDMNQQLTTEGPAVSEMDRLTTLAKRVFWPVGGSGKLRAVRRAVNVLNVIGTLVQIVVWLLISVFNQHLDNPWWLISTVGLAVIAVCLWIVDESGILRPASEGKYL